MLFYHVIITLLMTTVNLGASSELGPTLGSLNVAVLFVNDVRSDGYMPVRNPEFGGPHAVAKSETCDCFRLQFDSRKDVDYEETAIRAVRDGSLGKLAIHRSQLGTYTTTSKLRLYVVMLTSVQLKILTEVARQLPAMCKEDHFAMAWKDIHWMYLEFFIDDPTHFGQEPTGGFDRYKGLPLPDDIVDATRRLVSEGKLRSCQHDWEYEGLGDFCCTKCHRSVPDMHRT